MCSLNIFQLNRRPPFSLFYLKSKPYATMSSFNLINVKYTYRQDQILWIKNQLKLPIKDLLSSHNSCFRLSLPISMIKHDGSHSSLLARVFSTLMLCLTRNINIIKKPSNNFLQASHENRQGSEWHFSNPTCSS